MSRVLPVPNGHALTLAAGMTLLMAACGSATLTQPPTTSPPPTTVGPSLTPSPTAQPAAILLEVTTEGGFINPAATLGALPVVVVDDDGAIYTPAVPQDGMHPPLVPAVDVRHVGPDGAAAILAAIRAAGLDHEATGGIAADAGTTVFTVSIDGGEIVSRFVRGGGPGGPGGPGVPGASGGGDAPGVAAFDLLARLTDPSVAWGSSVAAASTYRPAGFRVFAAPGAPPDASAGDAPVAWPLAVGLDAFGATAVPDFGVTGLRSGVVLGSDAATLEPVLAAAGPATTFKSSGKPYTLWVRPLLPDELGS